MAGHALLKFVMTECSKTQIRLTGLNLTLRSHVCYTDDALKQVRGLIHLLGFVCLFVLRFYGPVNSLGHVEPVSYLLTLYLGKPRPTKR